MDKAFLAEIQRKVESLLEAEIAKGYSPSLVTTPEQDAKTAGCRMCGETSGKFGFVVVGRELRDKMVYVYCIPIVCTDCHGNEVNAVRFLNRIEGQYRAMEKKG